MQHTKENISKLIDGMIEEKKSLLKFFDEPTREDFQAYHNFKSAIKALEQVKRIIDDEKEFQEYCKIYFEQGEEQCISKK